MENTRELSIGAKTEQAPRAQARRMPRQKHGKSRLLRADRRQIDGRSALAISMNAYRSDLTASLGGKDNLSVQELTLVELASRDWAILQQVDAYILTVGVFSKRKKAAYALTSQRMQMADALTRRLQALGLSKRSRPVKSLNELLNASPEPTPEQCPLRRTQLT
jgi:hypothetical protein